MRRTYSGTSIGKPRQNQTNEDAVVARRNVAAVSDGAGGGGIYADLWSAYLLKQLPETPIASFACLDDWVDSIWEPFYAVCEESAKKAGGMVLNKFYDEGSFATLAVAWRTNEGFRWMSYGDSVVFCYRARTGTLEHSFTRLSDFDNPPYLINFKDKLHEEGFRSGLFKNIGACDVVFCATDALAHYVLMMYELSRRGRYGLELKEAERRGSKNAQIVKTAMDCRVCFKKDVIDKLRHCAGRKEDFRQHVEALLRKKLIALDDYSYAMTVG